VIKEKPVRAKNSGIGHISLEVGRKTCFRNVKIKFWLESDLGSGNCERHVVNGYGYK
jgi:hypothetical protein